MSTSDAEQPSVAEIAALTARLRHLRSPGATEAERAAFQADKAALLARIADPARPAGCDHFDAVEVAAEAVMAQASAGGYAMVGPSARTWAVDPATGIPTGPVSEAEHRLVRDLIAQERLDGADPVWLRCADGGDEIVAMVVPAPADPDEAVDDEYVEDERTEDERAEAVGGDDRDADGWFSGGYDAAHQAYLDELGHVNAEVEPGQAVLDADAHRVSSVLPPMPEQMREGIEERLAGPARTDDPAELQARLAELSARVSEAAGAPPGGWRTVSAADAAEQLVGRGYDVDTARALVVDYLRDTSERIGAPAHEWGLDQGDVVAIDAAHRLPEAARAVVEQDEADTARAAQLGRWHTDDQVAVEETASETDDGAVVESVDGTGWSE